MSFSFNENLLLESNEVIYAELVKIDKGQILEIMKRVAKEECSMDALNSEFNALSKTMTISGELIKNHFAIVLSGIEKVWGVLTLEVEALKPFRDDAFYEDVYSHLDELLDEITFDDLFKNELLLLNQ